ncbi:SDR family oxidoreductase [Nocardioides sp. cx-173]|uniref:SDR family oxidoreductase n=1 Tax=Nocardioides sp. cx-173 TaxID=2898796 RepID=UPI001E5617E0|nr:SDR family oxidoreductase [Nocardioides sp. cx-173]MCD4525038.1 SDR family oxidoreductase [Nocardioides sp. cx-173]UGB40254.1 SDR family oxidoreductase [Nocardioides sp. cx-173]
MSDDLKGLVAVVAGGSRGIGLACATALAGAGAAVVISSKHPASIARALRDADPVLGLEGIPADVTVEDEVAALVDGVVERHHRIDVLVNSAGIGGGGPTVQFPYARWKEIIDVNLNGAFLLAQHALARGGMAERGFGRIITIASTGGKQGVRLAPAYSASKAGVIAMTKALAWEFAGCGVTVNAVCPGFVDTELSAQSRARYAAADHIEIEEVKRRQLARIPIGRYVQVDEVANLVRFIAAPNAGAYTGQAINICGGLSVY